MKSRILSRYIWGQIVHPAYLGLGVYTFILIMNLIFRVAELAIRRSLPLGLVLQIAALAIPRILVLTVPVAVFLGIMVGLSRMGSDGEIVALRALGTSDAPLYKAGLGLGICGTLITTVLLWWAVPHANYAQHWLTARTLSLSNPVDEIQPRVFYEKVPGSLLYAEDIPPGGPLRRLFLYRSPESPDQPDEMTLAHEATLKYVTRGKQLSLEIQLTGGETHAVNPRDPGSYQLSRFGSQTIRLEPPKAVAARLRLLDEPPAKGLREQTLPELRQSIQNFMEHPNPRARKLLSREARMELNKMFATPCASIVLALLGVPLGLLNRRGARSSAFAMSLAVILVYWVLMTAGEDLLRKEVLASPFLAAWGPNLFFLILGTALSFSRVRWYLSATAAFLRRGGTRFVHWRPWVHRPGHPEEQRVVRAPLRRTQYWISLLDWLIASTFIRILTFILISAYALYLLVEAKGLIDNLLENKLPISLLLEYLAFRSPALILHYVLPVACLVGVLLVFSHLSRTGEMIAMQAGGISRHRAALPVILTTAALGVLSLLTTETILPASNQRAQELRAQIRGKRSPRTYYQPKQRWVFGEKRGLYSYNRALRGGEVLEGFSLMRSDPSALRLTERWYAESASWDGEAWRLRNGWLRTFAQDGGQEFTTFEERRLFLPEDPSFLAQEWTAPQQMGFVELRRYVKDLSDAGYDVRELRVDLQSRLRTPWVSLVMVLMALPFALRAHHQGGMAAVGLSLALGIIYFAVHSVGASLGKLGTLPPAVAVWGPSLFFAGIGLAMMPRVRT